MRVVRAGESHSLTIKMKEIMINQHTDADNHEISSGNVICEDMETASTAKRKTKSSEVIRLAVRFAPIEEALKEILVPTGMPCIYKIPMDTLHPIDQRLHAIDLRSKGYDEEQIQEWAWYVTVANDTLVLATSDTGTILRPGGIARATGRRLYVECHSAEDCRSYTYHVDEAGIASGCRYFETHTRYKTIIIREFDSDGTVLWEHPGSERLAA